MSEKTNHDLDQLCVNVIRVLSLDMSLRFWSILDLDAFGRQKLQHVCHVRGETMPNGFFFFSGGAAQEISAALLSTTRGLFDGSRSTRSAMWILSLLEQQPALGVILFAFRLGISGDNK